MNIPDTEVVDPVKGAIAQKRKPINRDVLNKEAGIAELEHSDGGVSCICCQRRMKRAQADRAEHLHLVSGGLDFGPVAMNDGGADMGCHPMGSGCARKIRKALKARGLDPDKWIEKAANIYF